MPFCPRKTRSLVRINIFSFLKSCKRLIIVALLVVIVVTVWMILASLVNKLRDSMNFDDILDEFGYSSDDETSDSSLRYIMSMHGPYGPSREGKGGKHTPYGETQDAPRDFKRHHSSSQYNSFMENIIDWNEIAESLPSANQLLSELGDNIPSSATPTTWNFTLGINSAKKRCTNSVKNRDLDNPTLIHSLNFSIEEVGLCNTNTIHLLVLVHSQVSHFERRSLIRRTYGSLSAIHGKQVRLLFTLGRKSQSKETQNIIENESRIYRDIIQGNFEDHWRNLTLNFNLALMWIGRHCPQLKYLVKVDDDTFLDTVHLLEFLQYAPKHNFTYCQVAKNRVPIRDNPASKWYVPRSVYRPALFPNYCLGFGFVLSADLLPRLLGCSLAARQILPLDDVFYTGVLARRAGLSPAENLWKGHGFDWLTRRHAADPNGMVDYIFLASKNNVVQPALWIKLWQYSLIALASTLTDE